VAGATSSSLLLIIAVSEAYESKASAKNGIESVRKNALDATVDDQT